MACRDAGFGSVELKAAGSDIVELAGAVAGAGPAQAPSTTDDAVRGPTPATIATPATLATAAQAQISAAEAIAIFRRHSSITRSNTLNPAVAGTASAVTWSLARSLAGFIGWSYFSIDPSFHSKCRTHRLRGLLFGLRHPRW